MNVVDQAIPVIPYQKSLQKADFFKPTSFFIYLIELHFIAKDDQHLNIKNNTNFPSLLLNQNNGDKFSYWALPGNQQSKVICILIFDTLFPFHYI